MPPIPRIANITPKAWMPMNMKLPARERAAGVEAATTLDAIVSGDRTATTRKNYADLQTMRRLQPGDTVGFFDANTGNTAMARVSSPSTQINPVAIADKGERDALLQNWAAAEGRNMVGAREHLYGANNPRVINIDAIDADIAAQNKILAAAHDDGDTAAVIESQKAIENLRNSSKFSPAPEEFHRTGLGGSGYQMEYEFIPGTDRSQSLLPPEQQSRIAQLAYQEPSIDFTPGPEYKNVNYRVHPTGREVMPIPEVLLDNGGRHHPDAQTLVTGEKLYRSVKTPEDKWIKTPLSSRNDFHIRQVNQAAGYDEDNLGLSWERQRPTSRLSEEASLYSVPTSNNFYTVDQSVRQFDSATRAGVSGKGNGLNDVVGDVYKRPASEQEIYSRNPLTAVGQRDILVSDQGRVNDTYRQEIGERVPLNVQRVRPDLPRATMPESDLLESAPQHRFTERRNTVPLPPQSISSPQEQAAIRTGLEADTERTLGGFTMNTRLVRVGDMPKPQAIEGAYLPVGKGYQPYTPSADLNQRSEEMSNLLIDVGGQKVPYVGSATAEIAGKEYPRDPALLPDAQDAIAFKRQEAARIRGQANVSEQSPTAPNTRPMWKNADQALDELNAGANTLRSVQAYDPAHNISSQAFDIQADVDLSKSADVYKALTGKGLKVNALTWQGDANNGRYLPAEDISAVANNPGNTLFVASGELPVEHQVELARSLRSTLNPTGGMMGLADADPEMAGLREQWKQQRESAIVDPVQQAKVDAAIARVRAQNGLGVMKPPSPRQTVEVLNQQDIDTMRPIARRTRRVDDDWLGIQEPSMADLGLPSAIATPPQSGFTLVGSPAATLTTSRPRSAGETFFQQNYAGVPQERALVPAQPEVQPSRAVGAYRGGGLSTNAQYDFAPDVDWQQTTPGALPQQPNWIIPSAIAGGVLGAGSLGYMAYKSQQEEESRKRQAAGW
jgi:hypothetical protein